MSAPPNGLLFGFYRGLVIDSDDPKQTGRVKIRIPDIMVNKSTCGEFCEGGLWARPGNLQLGGRNVRDTLGPRCTFPEALYQGQCLIPPKGSHVFVFFEGGDPNRPFYYGCADYGQNKILAEHRTGGKQYLKWTPMKTHEGRTLIFSDDPFDARVEITGKKRMMHNPPDGDFQSVYQIDGNQTQFMIEERPGHEKVMLKDYHGNYMKMIQNDAGRSDQFHLWMKDDIHIETLKNIYITAHESIHIKAYQDIYIEALNDMHIRVIQHFTEMAHLIDRYSETNDNLNALININQIAGMDVSVAAGLNHKTSATAEICRNAGACISDNSTAIGLQAAATFSALAGGAAFVTSAVTCINNGAAPTPSISGVEMAQMSPEATDANPDKERYQDVPDPPKPDPVQDKHEIWKCNKFWHPWKPKVQSKPSQCINAKVGNSGGCNKSYSQPKEEGKTNSGSCCGGGQSGEGSGGQPNGGNTPQSSSGPCKYCEVNSSGKCVCNCTECKLFTTDSNMCCSCTGCKENKKGTEECTCYKCQKTIKKCGNKDCKKCCKIDKISITNSVVEMLNNSGVITAESESYVQEKAQEIKNILVQNATDAINDALQNVDKSTKYICLTVKDEVMQQLDNILLLMYTDSMMYKNNVVKDNITNYINNIKFEGVIDNLSNYFKTRISDIKNVFSVCMDNYITYGRNLDDDIKKSYSTKILDSFESELQDNLQNLKFQDFYKSYLDVIEKDASEYVQSIRDYINNEFVMKQYNSVFTDNELSICASYKQTFNNFIDNIDLTELDTKYDLRNLSKDDFNNCVKFVIDKIVAQSNSLVQQLDNQIINEKNAIDTAKNIFDTDVNICNCIEKHVKDEVFNGDIHKLGINVDSAKNEVISTINTNNEDMIDNVDDSVKKSILDNIPDSINLTNTVIGEIVTQIPTVDVIDVNNIRENLKTDIVDAIKNNNNYDNIVKNVNTTIDVNNKFEDVKGIVSDVIKDVLNDTNDSTYKIQTLIDVDEKKNDELHSVIDVIKSKITDDLITEITKKVIQTRTDLRKTTNQIDSNTPTVDQINDTVDTVIDTVVDNIKNIIVNIKNGEDPETQINNIGSCEINVDNIDNSAVGDLKKEILVFVEKVLKPLEKIDDIKEIIDTSDIDEYDVVRTYQEHIYSMYNDIIDNISNHITNEIIDYDIPNIISTIENKDVIVSFVEEINFNDIIDNIIVPNIPTTTDLTNLIKDVIDKESNIVCNAFKNKINSHVILSNNTPNNEFNQDVDLTKIYTVPGKDVDYDSECSEHRPTTGSSSGYASNDNLNGGCGCGYTFLLFLKQRYYDTIFPMLVNDKCHVVSFDLNPNMDKYLDLQYRVHDSNIFDDYNTMLNNYFSGNYETSNNSYLDRIDTVMSEVEKYGMTTVINFCDFKYRGYKWLADMDESQKYTVVMWENENFRRFIKDVVRHITTKIVNGERVNRDCKIIFNLGNGIFINESDLDCEKYPMYPTCKFIREFVMFLSYKCNLSSNYIAITHNENEDLYYYNPYGEFKSYDDQTKHTLTDYSIEYINAGDEECITYNKNGDVDGGYFKYIVDCGNTKSYPVAYIDDITKYLGPDAVIDSNLFNIYYIPMARNAMRYMNCGHDKYFKHTDINFEEEF